MQSIENWEPTFREVLDELKSLFNLICIAFSGDRFQFGPKLSSDRSIIRDKLDIIVFGSIERAVNYYGLNSSKPSRSNYWSSDQVYWKRRDELYDNPDKLKALFVD